MSTKSKRTAGVTVRRITFRNQSDLLEYIRSRGIKLNKKK
jgi:hypothetical protein